MEALKRNGAAQVSAQFLGVLRFLTAIRQEPALLQSKATWQRWTELLAMGIRYGYIPWGAEEAFRAHWTPKID